LIYSFDVMEIVKRKVFGKILDALDSGLLVDKEIKFLPLEHFGSGDKTIPSVEVVADISEDGSFEAELFTFDNKGVEYECELPSKEVTCFILEYGDGSDIELQTLINNYEISSENSRDVLTEILSGLLANYTPNRSLLASYFHDMNYSSGGFDGEFSIQQSSAGLYNFSPPTNFADYQGFGLVPIYLKVPNNEVWIVINDIWKNNGTAGIFSLGYGRSFSDLRFAVENLSDANNSYEFYFGIANHYYEIPANGCYFKYTHSENNGNLQAITRKDNVETKVNTDQSLTLNEMQKIAVDVNDDATKVDFRFDGEIIATIEENIPTAKLTCFFWIKKTVGNVTTKTLVLDWIQSLYYFSNPR